MKRKRAPPKTLDWYADLELAALPPIQIRRWNEDRGKMRVRAQRKSYAREGEKIYETIGLYDSVIVDGTELSPKHGETMELEDPIACKRGETNRLDCWTVDWKEMFPTERDVASIKGEIARREDNLSNDDVTGAIFPDIATPRALELQAMVTQPLKAERKFIIEHATVKEDASLRLTWSWLDRFTQGMYTESATVDSMFNSYVFFLRKIQGLTDIGTTEDMMALIKVSAIVKNLLDPAKVISMIREPLKAFFVNKMHKELDAFFLARTDMTRKEAGIPYFDINFETASGIAFKRGLHDLIPAISMEQSVPFEFRRDNPKKTRSIVLERWIDPWPTEWETLSPEMPWNDIAMFAVEQRDTRSKEEHETAMRWMNDMKTPDTFASRNAFVDMFIKNEGWVERVKQRHESWE